MVVPSLFGCRYIIIYDYIKGTADDLKWRNIYLFVYVCSIFRFVPYAYLFIYTFIYITFVICVILCSKFFLSYKSLKLAWKNISKGIAIVHIGPCSTCLHHKKNLRKRLVSSVHHWLFIGKMSSFLGHPMVLQNLLNHYRGIYTQVPHLKTSFLFCPQEQDVLSALHRRCET